MLAALALASAPDQAAIERISIAKFAKGSPAERSAEVQRLRAAFEGQGMVVLVDHGCPSEVISATIDESRKFFALPRQRKEALTLLPDRPPRSYSAITTPRGQAYQVQQEDPATQDILNEWLLVRNSSVQYDPSDPYYTSAEGNEFYASEASHPEQAARWPEDVPGLQRATAAYYAAVERLTNTVYELFAVALELPADFFLARARHAPIWPVTIAHYPPQRAAPAAGSMRIQPHWDRTLFALITTSDLGTERAGGLQILVDADGAGADARSDRKVWRDVRAPAGSFIVNVGEMMARWTNGRFKHVVHRVPNPPPAAAAAADAEAEAEQGRISLMAYVLPDYDTPVDCAQAVCAATGAAPLYEPTWVGEMMNWGSDLPLYNRTRQEQMRLAQGLYSAAGEQTELGEPTDVNDVALPDSAPTTAKAAAPAAAAIDVIDLAPLVAGNASAAAQRVTADALSDAFARTGFALVRGHGVPAAAVEELREAARRFFAAPEAHKAAFDKGRGYGFGGYVRHAENGAQLLGDFSKPASPAKLRSGRARHHLGLSGRRLAGSSPTRVESLGVPPAPPVPP